MANFSTQELMRKLRSIPGMTQITDKAALLYVVFEDSDTPQWVKAAIVAALAYLINPADAVPDPLPGVGYSDDLTVLIGAVGTIKAYITAQHRTRAQQLLKRL
ncbi:YkvA family protein [Oceanospirillum sanctuarii]|uniref:YkvA family protein n=1 Tax=Oceanospirillum sanctuarii TaxID=1434821 RepID=UPI000A3A3717|nr:DUF1232 domain-containing protein [Oceanospirillum sanctuarii]